MKTDTPETGEVSIKISDGIVYIENEAVKRLISKLEQERDLLKAALELFVGQFDCYECTGTAEEALDSLN